MLLKNDAIHIQTREDSTRLKDAVVNATKVAITNSDGTFELATELANELSFEPYFECTGGESKLIFVFGK